MSASLAHEAMLAHIMNPKQFYMAVGDGRGGGGIEKNWL